MGHAVAAVGMKHMTWPVVLAHLDKILKISEDERSSKEGNMFLAILYDDLLRMHHWISHLRL